MPAKYDPIVPVFGDPQKDSRFDVKPGLKKLHMPCVIWAAHHEPSDCWLVIRDANPCMVIQWKLLATSSGMPLTVKYHCPTLNGQENLASAVALCEEYLKDGPTDQFIDIRNDMRAKQKASGFKGGIRSGEIRHKKAAAPPDYSKGPVFAKKTWEWQDQTDFDGPHWLLRHKSLPSTKIAAEDQQRNGQWTVYRDWRMDGNPDGAELRDVPRKELTWDEACKVISELAKTNPTKWTPENYETYLQGNRSGE